MTRAVPFLVGLLVALAAACYLVPAARADMLTHEGWRASTYGWPGDAPYQPLAGCGYRKIGGRDAGKPMPCRLSPRLPIVAHRTWRLGSYVLVCYRAADRRRCAGARVGDRCGPGCDANGVDLDLSWGLARRLRFPYGIAAVTTVRVAP